MGEENDEEKGRQPIKLAAVTGTGVPSSSRRRKTNGRRRRSRTSKKILDQEPPAGDQERSNPRSLRAFAALERRQETIKSRLPLPHRTKNQDLARSIAHDHHRRPATTCVVPKLDQRIAVPPNRPYTAIPGFRLLTFVHCLFTANTLARHYHFVIPGGGKMRGISQTDFGEGSSQAPG